MIFVTYYIMFFNRKGHKGGARPNVPFLYGQAKGR
jgi:hypothetical protein